jgi:hypothetical protein
MKLLVAVLIAAVGASFVVAAADVITPAAPQVLAGSGVGVGTRALGMGGAYTALASDATAMYWNPAGVSRVEGVKWALPFTAHSDGIDITGEAKDAYDAFKGHKTDAEQFASIKDIARRNNNRPASLTTGGFTGFAFRDLVVGAYGEAGGRAVLHYSDAPTTESVTVNGGAAWYYSFGGAVARSVRPDLKVGLALRKVWASFENASYTATRDKSTGAVTDNHTESPEYEDQAISADLGFLYTPPTIPGFSAGLMIRNLNAPSLNMSAGGTAVAHARLERSANLGVSYTIEGLTVAADVHNLFNAGNAGRTYHAGAEKHFGPIAARAGVADGDIVLGAGIDLGKLTIELAADPQLKKAAGVMIGLEF